MRTMLGRMTSLTDGAVHPHTRSCASPGAKIGHVTIAHLALEVHSSEENTASGERQDPLQGLKRQIDCRPLLAGLVTRWWRGDSLASASPMHERPRKQATNPIRGVKTPARWLIILPVHHDLCWDSRHMTARKRTRMRSEHTRSSYANAGACFFLTHACVQTVASANGLPSTSRAS
jgi:hypothetical protein